MDDTLILVILACVILIVLIFGLIYLINQLRPIDGIRAIEERLGSSTGLGLGGEKELEAILKPWISANLVTTQLAMPQSRSNVEYAYNVGKSRGRDFWIPIDNKKGGTARKNIEDVGKKYVGKNDGNIPFTTPFAIITTNEPDYAKYEAEKWKILAKEYHIIVVKHSQIIPFLEFLQWYFDKFQPMSDLSAVINLALRWETHHDKAKELTEKITKAVDEFKKHIIDKPDKIEATIPLPESSEEESAPESESSVAVEEDTGEVETEVVEESEISEESE